MGDDIFRKARIALAGGNGDGTNGDGKRGRGRPKGYSPTNRKLNGVPLGRPPGSRSMHKNGRPDPPLITKRVTDKTLDMVMGVVEDKAQQLSELVLEQLRLVATSDIRRLPGCPQDIPDDIAPAISSFEIVRTVHTGKDGSVTESEKTRYNLWPKLQAVDQLARHTGFYQLDNTQRKIQANIQVNNYHVPDYSHLTEEQLQELYELELRRAKLLGDPIVELLPAP